MFHTSPLRLIENAWRIEVAAAPNVEDQAIAAHQDGALLTGMVFGDEDHLLLIIPGLVICYIAIENDHRNSGFSH